MFTRRRKHCQSSDYDMQDYAILVDFIFRITYATNEQLGWDQSMRLVELSAKDDKPQYDITVMDDDTNALRIFRTKRMISNIGADTLRGRGTRVWEVVELDKSKKESGGETCVLKDSWVDDDRDREGRIIEKIRADATAAQERADDEYEKAPEGEKPDRSEIYDTINRSLLTVVTYGDVRAGQQPDKTRNWKSPEAISLKSVRVTSKASDIVQTSLQAAGSIAVETGAESPNLAVTEFSTKTHHRIVFKEVGMTIREVPPLSLAFICIREVAIGEPILPLYGS